MVFSNIPYLYNYGSLPSTFVISLSQLFLVQWFVFTLKVEIINLMYYAALDQSTTSTKIAIYDQQGKSVLHEAINHK